MKIAWIMSGVLVLIFGISRATFADEAQVTFFTGTLRVHSEDGGEMMIQLETDKDEYGIVWDKSFEALFKANGGFNTYDFYGIKVSRLNDIKVTVAGKVIDKDGEKLLSVNDLKVLAKQPGEKKTYVGFIKVYKGQVGDSEAIQTICGFDGWDLGEDKLSETPDTMDDDSPAIYTIVRDKSSESLFKLHGAKVKITCWKTSNIDRDMVLLIESFEVISKPSGQPAAPKSK